MFRINPVEQQSTFRVNGIRSSRPQKRAIEFEKNLAKYPDIFPRKDPESQERVQWYFEDHSRNLAATAAMVTFPPFTAIPEMPFPLRFLLRKGNFAQLRGEQLHFISNLVIDPAYAPQRIIEVLAKEVYTYCILCSPGTIVLNIDRPDLVTQLVIDGWEVYGKCAADIFGERNTILLGKQTGIEFLHEMSDEQNWG